METQAEYATKQITYLPVWQIVRNPRNPRKTIDENSIQELAKSIIEIGVMSPIIVRPAGDGFELVAGERRWRATQIAGVDQIPAIIRELTDDEAMDLAITENLQRQDVSPLEEADAFQSLVDHRGYDVKQLADRFGKSETYIRGRLKLNDLIPEFKIILEKEVIGMSHANVVSKLDAETQGKVFKQHFGTMTNSWWTCPTAGQLKNAIENQFSSDLKDAKFDLTDSNLIPSVGACTACQWNTAGDGNLFPDSISGRCLKTSCFEQKETLHRTIRLNQVKDDPSVLILHSWYPDNDEKKEINDLKAEGIAIVDQNNFDLIEKPEPPEQPDPSDYDMNDPDDVEQYESEMEDYKGQVVDFNSELAKYEEAIKSPEAMKYFIAVGRNAGEEGYCLPDKRKAGSLVPELKEKSPNEAKKQTIAVQIVDLKGQLTRISELNDQKIFDVIKPEFLKVDYSKNDTFILSELEWEILFYIILDDFNWWRHKEFGEVIFGEGLSHADDQQKLKALANLDDSKKARLIRKFIEYKITDHAGPDKSGQKGFTKLLFKLSAQTLADGFLEDTSAKVAKKSDTRRTNIQARISELEAEIAKLEAESKPKGKKKGKSSEPAN